MADMVAKGRSAKGDKNASRLYPERRPRGNDNWTRRHPELLPRGESHANAKLTDVEAAEIRTRYAVGDVSQSALGHEYHISQAGISRIVRGVGYRTATGTT